MKILDAKATDGAISYGPLIDCMEKLFATGITSPARHHHTLPMENEVDATLLLMPAWDDRIGCVKIVTATPGNAARSLPSIAGSVLVFDRTNGEHLALVDGAVLTAKRTAAASALGARFLAPQNASKLLVVGSGKVAAQLPAAFASVRPIEEVSVWNVNPASAERLVEKLCGQGWSARLATDLEEAVGKAGIISCATLAREPILQGKWLKPGQHVDLLGAFTPQMREADDEALIRAKIFVDTDHAINEAGELKIPLETGVIEQSAVLGNLYDLASGKVTRQSNDEITLFKSVGNAVLDLAAAMSIFPSQ